MKNTHELIKALTHRADRKFVPLWELEFHLWGKISGRDFILGKEFIQLSKAGREKAMENNAAIMAEVSGEIGFSAITVPGGYWEIAPGLPAYYWLPDEYRFRQAALIKKKLAEETLLIANTGGILAMPDSEVFVEFSMELLMYPENINLKAEQIFQSGIKNVNRFLDAGITIFFTASDLGDSKGPYFSPEQMENLIYPYLMKWSEYITSHGGYGILHSDGNILPYLDKISETGIHALQAIDPNAGMNLAALLPEYHERLCLCGNLDNGMILSSDPERIYRETELLLSICRDYKGFVLGCSNAVQAETPVENYLAMIRAWKDHKSIPGN